MSDLQIALRGFLEIKPKEKVLNSYIEQCLLDVTTKIKEIRVNGVESGLFVVLSDWEARLDVIERNISKNE